MRGLYVHIPFCLQKCSYCDFVSYANCLHEEEAYVKALLFEFAQYQGEQIDTVYFGGGTPTALKTESLAALLDGVFRYFRVQENAEITVECNPKTADMKKFKTLLSHGANRLSIGVQSFDEQVLNTIGRIHSGQDAVCCIEDASAAGFENISADLMFGIPNQSIDAVHKSVEMALRLPLQHISCYGLILEESTPLYQKVQQGELSLPDEDTEFQMYQDIIKMLEKKDFLQYEISNFAKKGYESRHNQIYWNAQEYIGCGAGAHSYYQTMRYCHTDDIKAYIQNPTQRIGEYKVLKEDAMNEFMILGLRKKEGVSKKEFFARFHEDMEKRYKAPIERFVNLGLIISAGDILRLSEDGVYVSNTVLCEFM